MFIVSRDGVARGEKTKVAHQEIIFHVPVVHGYFSLKFTIAVYEDHMYLCDRPLTRLLWFLAALPISLNIHVLWEHKHVHSKSSGECFRIINSSVGKWKKEFTSETS